MSPHVSRTTPYPWPYDGDLDGRGTALVVLAPGASAGASPEVAAAIGSLARAVQGNGGPVVVATTRLPARIGQPGPAAGSLTPLDLLDLLDGEAPNRVVDAGGLDAFYASDLDLVLRTSGIRRLLLVGCGLETAVHSTLRDANDRGYECLLVLDACFAVDPSLTPASVSMIEMSGGIFGAVGLTADVLDAMGVTDPAATSSTPVPPASEGVPT